MTRVGLWADKPACARHDGLPLRLAGGPGVRVGHGHRRAERLSRHRAPHDRRERVPTDPLRADHAARGLRRGARRAQPRGRHPRGLDRLADRRALLVSRRARGRRRAGYALGRASRTVVHGLGPGYGAGACLVRPPWRQGGAARPACAGAAQPDLDPGRHRADAARAVHGLFGDWHRALDCVSRRARLSARGRL